jgi:hypothetical protein
LQIRGLNLPPVSANRFEISAICRDRTGETGAKQGNFAQMRTQFIEPRRKGRSIRAVSGLDPQNPPTRNRDFRIGNREFPAM